MNLVPPYELPSKISYFQAFALTSPALALTILVAPIGLLPSIFAKYYGVSLVGMGAVLLFIHAFDTITDVLIGHFSDRFRLRHGTRKPFVIVGGLLSLPSAYFLVTPPGGEVTVFSFAIWSTAFYLCFTLINIPQLSWAGELTNVPEERTFIFSMLAFVKKIAELFFYITPFLPFFGTQEITHEVLRFSVIVGICMMLPMLYLSANYVPNGFAPTQKESIVKSHTAAFKDYLAVFKANKPFQVYMGAYIFIGLGLGMYSGLLFMYIDVFLGVGELFATMLIVGVIAGLLLTPLSFKLIVWLGKRDSWMISTVLLIAGVFYTSMLLPGQVGITDLIAVQVVLTAAGITLVIVGPSMLNDTVDYGLLHMENGTRGVYLALYTFLVKIEIALGASLGLALAGWLGFQASEQQQTAEGAFAIRFTMCWLPMAIICLGLYFIHRIPLTEARMAIIGRRLRKRASLDRIPGTVSPE